MKTGKFFEINVSGPDGKHLFATDSTIRSYDEEHIEKLMTLFQEKFPEEEKYKITITTWDCGSTALPENLKRFI